MILKPKYSSKEIRDLYAKGKCADEKIHDYFMYFIFRPLSFYPSALLASLGISANTITISGLMIALSLPLFPWLEIKGHHHWIFILTFIFQILDCVDGNLARLHTSNNKLGQYLDSFTGKVYHLSLYMTCAWMAVLEHRITWSLSAILALITFALFIWGRESRIYVKFYCLESGTPLINQKIGIKNLVFAAIELSPFLLWTAGFFNFAFELSLMYFLHATGIFLASQWMILQKLRTQKKISD